MAITQEKADKPLNYRQSLFVEYYTGDNGTKGNATASAVKAGYTWKFANQACKYLLGNIRVKAQIDAKRVDIGEKIEHNFEIAAKMLGTDFEHLTKKAEEGNVQAIQARTAILRELDDIAGLKQQNINVTTDQQRELNERQAKDAKIVANIINMQELREA